jgi:hypothetical protein
MSICFVQAAGTIELYFYGELGPAARAETEAHLARCEACRRALADLDVIRTALASRPAVAAPPGGDWTGFMARLDDAIRGQEIGGRAPGPGPAPSPGADAPAGRRPYIVYAAMAALLALISLSVAHIVRSRLLQPPADADVAAAMRGTEPRAWSPDAAFAALAEQHFDRSKLVVLGLANKSASQGTASEWQYERELASGLLADTRLYRLAAEDRGFTELARTLGDLELVLLQASLSSDPQPETLAQIQRLIHKRDLVTRMNVMAAAGM